MIERKAFFAGHWYSYNKDDLIRELETHFDNETFGPGELPQSQNKDSRTIIGGVSPHAGYTYSGPCAAHTYLNLFKERIPDTIVILGTHHHYYTKVGLMEKGEWKTPLGNLKIDEELASLILENAKLITEDTSGFINYQEHNIEIQLPFIKYCAGNKDVKILPIKVTNQINQKEMDRISNEIVSGIDKSNKDIILVASSDMSHYDVSNQEQMKTLKEIDHTVIDQFLNFNPENILYPEKVISQEDYGQFRADQRGPSICGRQTIATLVSIGKKMKTSQSKLLKYYTSKDISTGGGTWTVGYFSGVISR
ncbi:MAG: AmmeMemoRadiSam system protein B [Promethearchaeota archaeon]|nr:MAG: AmmeMemoRadiSam system protein B [Candidatus Lokiarchaeota archaeon]